MLTLPVLLVSFGVVAAPVYTPPRTRRPRPVEQPATAVTAATRDLATSAAALGDPSLSDAEVQARVRNYLSSIDVGASVADWRAVGVRALPLLQQVLDNREELSSRRAGAIAGVAAVGGARARTLVLQVAESEREPFFVRAAALRCAPLVLDAAELVRELVPVLESANEPATRAAAAEVLARHAPAAACGAVRSAVEREAAASPRAEERDDIRARFARSIEQCDAALAP